MYFGNLGGFDVEVGLQFSLFRVGLLLDASGLVSDGLHLLGEPLYFLALELPLEFVLTHLHLDG